MMTFEEVVDQALAMLQRRGWVTSFGQIIQMYLFVSSYTPFHAHSSSCIPLCHASYSPSVCEEPREGEQPHGLEDVTDSLNANDKRALSLLGDR